MPPADRQTRPSGEPSAEILARIWRQAPVGLALLEDDVIVAWNPAAQGLLAGAVGGEPHAWRQWLAAAALRLLAQPGAPAVLSARQPQGTALELAVAGEGAPGPAVLALRAAPAEAVPAGERNLVETVSTLSHELRTPLASMKSSLSLVLGGDAGPLNDDQRRFLDMTVRNVMRLDRLVGDLLDLSRDDVGRLRVDCRPTDLGPALREALSLYELAPADAGPSLDLSGIPEHFLACVDPDKIAQIVGNLVGNARKYVPADGRVRVWLDPHPTPLEPVAVALAAACDLDARTFTLVVEDNGPGIDPGIVDRVFEPFERGRAEVIGRIGGAGLGLHIVRRLAEAHGGKVSLATAPGAGTTIWVRLPVEPAGGQLLKAAGQLRIALEQASAGPEPALAVLDARSRADGEAVLAAGRAWLAGAPAGQAGRPCEPAPGVLAVAVADPGRWDRDGQGAASGWRLLSVPREHPGGPAGTATGGKPERGTVERNA
jgi:signal transduction histidine kinase